MLHLDLGPGIGAAISDRSGGTSRAPYATLNLSDQVGDDPTAVAANRSRVAETLGVAGQRVTWMRQVHGRDIAVVTADPDRIDRSGPGIDGIDGVDGVVTADTGRPLAVLLADCVPMLLADPQAGVIGVAHAGRRGMQAGIADAVVSAMSRLGAQPERTVAVLGPAICAGCYEVPAPMRAAVGTTVPAAWATSRRGTPSLDLRSGLAAQLAAHGVRSSTVPACTAEDDRYFSYRRDGRTGRFAGFIWRP